MLVDDNRGWTRGPFRDHNSEVVSMRGFLTAQQLEGSRSKWPSCRTLSWLLEAFQTGVMKPGANLGR